MKTSRKTKGAEIGTSGTSSASKPLNISTIVIKTFRQNKSKMKTLTEVDLIAALERALATEDQPIREIEFDPAELEYDSYADMYPIPYRPSKPADATSVLTPSKVSTSRSVSITIRVPAPVVNAFKAMAREKCVGYQTLMNRQLRSILAGS